MCSSIGNKLAVCWVAALSRQSDAVNVIFARLRLATAYQLNAIRASGSNSVGTVRRTLRWKYSDKDDRSRELTVDGVWRVFAFDGSVWDFDERKKCGSRRRSVCSGVSSNPLHPDLRS